MLWNEAKHCTNVLKSRTKPTQHWWNRGPDTDAALAEPLSYGQLQVEQGEAHEHQSYQVGDEERAWGHEVNINVSRVNKPNWEIKQYILRSNDLNKLSDNYFLMMLTKL